VEELERIELAAILDFFAAAPPDVVDELDLAVLELDEGAAFSIGAEPKPLLFNRVLGLADDGALPEIERWSASRDCPLAVSAGPHVELEERLSKRGYERSRTYMKFRRDTHHHLGARRRCAHCGSAQSTATLSGRSPQTSMACRSRWHAGSARSAGGMRGSVSEPSTTIGSSARAVRMS
jgi:hypothetical protein